MPHWFTGFIPWDLHLDNISSSYKFRQHFAGLTIQKVWRAESWACRTFRQAAASQKFPWTFHRAGVAWGRKRRSPLIRCRNFLTDFGESFLPPLLNDTTPPGTHVPGPLFARGLSSPSDIWSFACTIWSIMSRFSVYFPLRRIRTQWLTGRSTSLVNCRLKWFNGEGVRIDGGCLQGCRQEPATILRAERGADSASAIGSEQASVTGSATLTSMCSTGTPIEAAVRRAGSCHCLRRLQLCEGHHASLNSSLQQPPCCPPSVELQRLQPGRENAPCAAQPVYFRVVVIDVVDEVDSP